jgi:hypothetical protein
VYITRKSKLKEDFMQRADHKSRRHQPAPRTFGFIRIVLLLIAGLALLLNTGCAISGSSTISVDISDPESVLEAYFKAWEQEAWSFQASLMDKKYSQMVPEPVDFLHILDIQAVPGTSASECTYLVEFEIKVKGEGVSMKSGKYNWTYYLSWDEKRSRWLITNYGAG